jgi:hypothetical protein
MDVLVEQTIKLLALDGAVGNDVAHIPGLMHQCSFTSESSADPIIHRDKINRPLSLGNDTLVLALPRREHVDAMLETVRLAQTPAPNEPAAALVQAPVPTNDDISVDGLSLVDDSLRFAPMPPTSLVDSALFISFCLLMIVT